MAARLPRWVAELRSTIKREHGFGWSVRDVHGKVQLTRRFENDTRSSVVLELSWDPSCVTTLLALIKEIRSRDWQARTFILGGQARGPVMASPAHWLCLVAIASVAVSRV